MDTEVLEKLAYEARRKYQDERSEKEGGMTECIMIDAIHLQKGYIIGFRACEAMNNPRLACATTQEVIYELSARCDTGNIDKGCDYKTIDI